MPVVPGSYNTLVTTSGQALIKRALRLLRVIQSGETLDADMQTDGLEALNSMLDSWNTESLAIPARTLYSVTLTANQQDYNIGNNEELDIPRPVSIEPGQAFLKWNDVEYPLNIYNAEDWANIRVKDMISKLPSALYYDRGFPVGQVHFWPPPDQGYTLNLWLWTQLTQISSAVAKFTLPQGYARALAYNLAVEYSPEFGPQNQPSPVVVALARNSKENIERSNVVIQRLLCDPAILGHQGGVFNILTGDRVLR